MELDKLKKINETIWEISRRDEMLVPGRIYAPERMIKKMDTKVYEQLSNVARLPGIVKYAVAMPDAHWGYGFPIGGVGAFKEENGVISVGGVGFDGGCGVRLYAAPLKAREVDVKELMERIFRKIPAGLGRRGEIRLSQSQLEEVLINGAEAVVHEGYGKKIDLKFIEDRGKMPYADPSAVSKRAIEREKRELGTLGSGNHYLEVQVVDKIFDHQAAKIYGLTEGQLTILIHCGSRALGHQIASDYLKVLGRATQKYRIRIRDRELVCAPIRSPEGKAFFKASMCALNYAYANRQVIGGMVENLLKEVCGFELELVWDLMHNSCRIEEHTVDGEKLKLFVHRKGATRAFGPGRKELPDRYLSIGQPVLIGGTMGTESWVLKGTKVAMQLSFGSGAHGAGRAMSRTKAKKKWRGEKIIRELGKKGIIVKAHSLAGVAEEAPLAYKDVREVVDALDGASIATKVARLKPLGCLKG